MPITVLIRPGGGGVALDYGPVTGLTLTPSAAGIGVSFTPKAALGAKYLVEYLSGTDKAEQPNNPFRWKRLTFIPSSATSYTYKHAWELENYDVRVTTVAPDGSKSAPVTATTTMPQWVAQGQNLLYSEDISQTAIWAPDAGVIVTNLGAGNGYTVNFGAAGRNISQVIPVITGQANTVAFQMKGTAGQTISLFAHAMSESGGLTNVYTLPTNYTFVGTGTAEWAYFVRPATVTGDVFIRVGIQTYNSATATSVTFMRARVSVGTTAQTAFTAGYVASTGPGSTWQDPMVFSDFNVPAGGLTWAGYHRNSVDPTVPCMFIRTARMVTLTGRAQGVGDLVTSNFGNAQLDMIGMMLRADHPGVAGRTRGFAFRGDFHARLRIVNNYSLQTSGSGTQVFQGYGATQNFQVDQNIWDDIDGRYAAGATGYVQGAWGSTQSRPPGAPLGWQGVNMARLTRLTPQGTNPYVILNSSISRNLTMTRAGFSRVEDMLNLSGAPGPDVNNPIRVHQNFIDSRGVIYDFNALATLAAGGATSYSTGSIPGSFALTLTAAAAVLASAATMTLTTPARVSLSAGQVLSFGGASVTVAAGYDANSTTLPLNGAGAAVASGAVATLTRTDSPGYYSGSWCMPADSSTHDSVTLAKNQTNVELFANRAIGQGIFGLLDGKAIRYIGNRAIGAATLPDGVTNWTGPRTPGPQITQYIGDGFRDSNAMIGNYFKTGYLLSYLVAADLQNAAPNSNYSGTPRTNERYENNTFSTTAATVDEEWAELAAWSAEMAAAGIQIGPFA